MRIENGFVINPDQYLLPHYKISPFRNQDMFIPTNPTIDSNTWEKYATQRWGTNNFQLTMNGREALDICLNLLKVNSESVVTILTSSGNKYVSSCVTNTIEKHCKWNRDITNSTNLILVIHEFGKTFNNLEYIKNLGVPIIEDCAYSFLNSNSSIGSVGNYCIYSMPKIFPIQLGGILTSSTQLQTTSTLTYDAYKYLTNQLNSSINLINDIIEKRNSNYQYLKQKLGEIGFNSRFNFVDGEIPGVFMFELPNNVDLQKFKIYCNNNGIESSVFYGENAYFIPCHQNLNHKDLDYFTTIISTFSNYA